MLWKIIKKVKDFTNFSDDDFYYRGNTEYNIKDKNSACKDWKSA